MRKLCDLRRCIGVFLLASGVLAALIGGLTLPSIQAAALASTAPMPRPLQPPAPATPQPNAGPGAGTRDGGDEVERKGMIVTFPTTFTGDWIILQASGLTQTVVVDAATDIHEFDGELPEPGSWVKAKGTLRNDGALLALRLRPDEIEDGQLVVRFNQTVDIHAFADHYHLDLLSEVLASANIYLFTTEDEHNTLAQMQNDSRVRWAEFNYVNGIPNNPAGDPFRTWEWGGQDDTGYVNQHAFAQVNLAPAQALYQGSGVIVAILDTGIDLAHPAFAGHLLPGWDMVTDDVTPQDECCGVGQGHGTHVAGVIAAVAPQSQLLPVRVLDPSGRGNTFVLAYAIEWAASQGADVINLSLGADFDSTVLSESIASAAAQGIVVVAAVGNDSATTPRYPAAFPHVVGVTAVDADDKKASFANYGADWVDLAAPGVGITSTVVGPQGSGYAVWGGTSMATPFVSGAAALAREKLPAVTADDIALLLAEHGADIDVLNPEQAGQLGRRLDIGAALSHEGPVDQAYRLFLPAVERR